MSEILVNTIKKADGTGSITVPADSGTLLTSASTLSSSNLSGALPAIDGSSLTGLTAGITEADQWRTSANQSRGNGDIIDEHWERNDYRFALIGTGMSYSSGVWTFPTTGIWMVKAFASLSANSGGSNFLGFRIEGSTDGGSTWGGQAEGYADARGTAAYAQVACECIFDVPDASQRKIRLVTVLEDPATFEGANNNRTCITFIRLGDT